MHNTRADRWLLYSLCAFFLMTGASLWETMVFVPVWASGNPATLTVLEGDAGLNSAALWVIVHSLFEIILLLTLVFNWKTKSRRTALVLLGILYTVIRAWTVFYFAPSFLDFQRLSSHPPIASSLIAQTLLWEKLNYVRTALVAALNIAMLLYVNRVFLSEESNSSPARLEGLQ
jgi:hypothetical protein